MRKKTVDQDPSPASVLRSYLERFDAKQQKLVRAIRTALKKRFPTANELAYDYKSHIVLSYAPSDRGIDGVCAIDARADSVRLYVHGGPKLPDPTKLLKGAGKMARYVKLESARRLSDPEIAELLVAAAKLAPVPMPKSGKGKLILRP